MEALHISALQHDFTELVHRLWEYQSCCLGSLTLLCKVFHTSC